MTRHGAKDTGVKRAAPSHRRFVWYRQEAEPVIMTTAKDFLGSFFFFFFHFPSVSSPLTTSSLKAVFEAQRQTFGKQCVRPRGFPNERLRYKGPRARCTRARRDRQGRTLN